MTGVRLAWPASLRGRLIVWHGLVLGLVLVIFTVVVYSLLAVSLAAEVDASLVSRAQKAGQILALDARLAGRQHIDIPPPETLDLADTFVQVSTLDDEVLGTSDNLEEATLPLDAATVAALATEAGQGHYSVAVMSGQRLRLYTTLLWLDSAPVAVIQVARGLDPVDEALARLAWLASGGLALALGLASLGIWLTTGRALRPLERLIATADAIEALPDLHQRVELRPTSDEAGRLAATFNRMLARLEAADAVQQRFIADASHELRTPLTTIRGNAELLLEFPDVTPEDRAAALAQIRQEAERLSRLVHDLLTLARADARLMFERRPVALAPLLDDVLAQVRLLLRDRRLEVNAAPGATIIGDADALRQLLLILLDNAVKYTPDDGRIAVRLGDRGGWAEVVVADDGCGIAAVDLPHIFERFYRADRARRAGGTGLGLAIAKAIVDQHGGTITVASVLGQGTTFTVRLPCAGAGAPTSSYQTITRR